MAMPVLLLLLLTVAATAHLSPGQEDFQSFPGDNDDNPSVEELLERALSNLNELALQNEEENLQTRFLDEEDTKDGLGFPAEDEETRNFGEVKRGEGLGFPTEEKTGEDELDIPGLTTDEVKKALYRRLEDDTTGEKNDDDADQKPMVRNPAKRGWSRRRSYRRKYGGYNARPAYQSAGAEYPGGAGYPGSAGYPESGGSSGC